MRRYKSVRMVLMLGFALLAMMGRTRGVQAAFTPLINQPPAFLNSCLLLTDGSVMCQGFFSNTWHRLTPDAFGSYLNGTWDAPPIAPMPDATDARIGCTPCAYSPLFFASQVLPDGKVVVVGGEDLGSVPGQVETNIGFMYDPVTNTWSSQLASAFDSGTVGDTMSTVLQNGTMIVSQITSGNIEAFNEATLSFTALNPPGKADINNEEGWNILPNGKILTVDAFIQAQSEFYDPVANTWGTPLNTIVNMTDTGNLGGTFEVGPATLRPDGLLISFSGNSLGQNAFFNTLTNTWSHPAGIDFPLVAGQTFHFAVRDGSCATLPNGNVIVMAAPTANDNGFSAPSHFWELDFATNTLNQVADSPNAAAFAAFMGHFMMLPSGEALFVAFNQGATQDVDVYSNGGAPQNAWRPAISSSPATIVAGSANNPVSGTLFNGLSQGGAYGDDSQSFTNYPLVRITNNASGHVFYARTHNHNRMGVEALGSTAVTSTQFDAPANLETGACTLVVVANGIASLPATCTVANNQAAVACESGLSFLVDDRAQVQNGTGGPGAINNNGTGTTRLSPDSRSGAITSRAAVSIQHRSVVTGNVLSASTVTKDADATVTGTITQNGTVNLPALPTLPAFPPPTLGSFTVNSGTVSKAPGSYVSGSVNGGTLVLATGDYFFQSLTLNAAGTVRATPTTRIFVQNTLIFNSSIRALTGSAIQPIFLGLAMSTSTSLAARFDGTVVAPNGTVVFGIGSPLTFSGSFFARTIEVGSGSTLACH
jgi:Kelch motif